MNLNIAICAKTFKTYTSHNWLNCGLNHFIVICQRAWMVKGICNICVNVCRLTLDSVYLEDVVHKYTLDFARDFCSRTNYLINSNGHLYAPSHKQDSTYHNLCHFCSEALHRTRNKSMGPPRWIDPMAHCTMSGCSITELCLALV